jgi:hypothetical protein
MNSLEGLQARPNGGWDLKREWVNSGEEGGDRPLWVLYHYCPDKRFWRGHCTAGMICSKCKRTPPKHMITIMFMLDKVR